MQQPTDRNLFRSARKLSQVGQGPCTTEETTHAGCFTKQIIKYLVTLLPSSPETSATLCAESVTRAELDLSNRQARAQRIQSFTLAVLGERVSRCSSLVTRTFGRSFGPFGSTGRPCVRSFLCFCSSMRNGAKLLTANIRTYYITYLCGHLGRLTLRFILFLAYYTLSLNL